MRVYREVFRGPHGGEYDPGVRGRAEPKSKSSAAFPLKAMKKMPTGTDEILREDRKDNRTCETLSKKVKRRAAPSPSARRFTLFLISLQVF